MKKFTGKNEIILVILLFIILGGVSFIKYKKAKEEIIKKKVVFNMYALKTGLESFKRDSGFYPSDLSLIPSIDTLVNPVTGEKGIGKAVIISEEMLDSGKAGTIFYIPQIKEGKIENYTVIGFNREGKKITLTLVGSTPSTP